MTELFSTKFFSGWVSAFQKPALAGFCAAIIAAGCSADVTRFGGNGFSLNTDEKASLLPSESLTGSSGAPLSQQSPDPGYGGTRSYGSTARIETSALSDRSRGYSDNRARRRDVAQQSGGATNTYANARLEKGRPITVQRGDTLYGLSRRHGVSVAELMSVNGLSDSMLRVGQRLYVPTTGSSSQGVRSASRPAPRQAVARVDTPSTWNGSYRVQSGDSLYKIARQYGVRSSELQRYNAITDPRRVMPGTVLKVPGGGRPNTYAASRDRVLERPVPRKSSGDRYAALTNGGSSSDAVSAPKGVRTVAIKPVDISRPVTAARGDDDLTRLKWPVRGKLIAGFGSRPDGTHNDGVNFAVPVGTEVRAADEGVVAYAGSELRSYGNLILLRHDNGWVTAYAHNSRLMVSRGDKVSRGQVIAKSGDSGQVDQPQVHFELRQSSKKPVDPIPYLEKL